MIKSDLVWRIRQQNPHLRVRDVETIVNTIFDEIAASLADGRRVELRAFSVKVYEARAGRNPRTGALVPIAETAHPRFKAGLEMRQRLNRREE
jgi:integration host factor subunit beta